MYIYSQQSPSPLVDPARAFLPARASLLSKPTDKAAKRGHYLNSLAARHKPQPYGAVGTHPGALTSVRPSAEETFACENGTASSLVGVPCCYLRMLAATMSKRVSKQRPGYEVLVTLSRVRVEPFSRLI